MTRSVGDTSLASAEQTISSAATTNIASKSSNFVVITGTNTITSLGNAINRLIQVRFSGSLTLTHNSTSLILIGGVNIVTEQNDTAIFLSDSSGNWRMQAYSRASGKSLTGPSSTDITNASASGRSVLTGTPAQGATALGLGTGSVPTFAGYNVIVQGNLNGVQFNGSGQPNVLSVLPWVTSGAYNQLVSTGDLVLMWRGPNVDAANAGSLCFVPWSNSAFGLKVTSTGKTGINKTYPQYPLDVAGVVSADYLYSLNDIRVVTTENKGGITLRNGDASNSGYVEFNRPTSSGVYRDGYIGYSTGNKIFLAGEQVYFNFVGKRVCIDDVPIWHSNDVASYIDARTSGFVRLSQYISTNDDPNTNADKLQAAMNFCIANKKVLIIDSGRTFLIGKRSSTSGTLTILGEDRRTSELRYTANAVDGGGIYHTLGNPGWADNITIKSVLITTLAANAGRAIDVHVTSSAAADRMSVQAVFEDVTIRGATHPKTDGWQDGVRTNGVVNPVFSRLSVDGFLSSGNVPSFGAAIDYNNADNISPHGAGASINDCYINHYTFGMRGYDFEMMTITGGAIQNCAYGVLWDGPNTYPQAHLIGVHINATFRCVLVRRMQEVQIVHSTLYLQDVNTQNTGNQRPAHIDFVQAAGMSVVEGNTFVVFDGSYAADGVLLQNANRVLIDANVFRSLNADPGLNPNTANRNAGISADATGVAVQFLSSTLYCKVTDTNTYDDSKVYKRTGRDGTKNIFGGIFKRTSGPEGIAVSYMHNDGLITQEGEKVVTSDGSGYATIAYVTPFPDLVVSRSAVNSDADTSGVTRVVPVTNGSSSTLMRIRLLDSAGNPATNTSVRVTWRATGISE